MADTRGYYGVIQYCPDLSRGEGANVGVLLFCPETGFLDVRMSRGNDRARRFFRADQLDLDRLKAAKSAFESRIRLEKSQFRTLDDLRHFVETRANDLRIIPPRPMRVSDPEKELTSLFAELVGGRAKQAGLPEAISELDELLRAPEVAPRVQFDQDVIVPVLDVHVRIPYAYRNGSLNLVKPCLFPATEEKATSQAGRWALRGDLLMKYPDTMANGMSRKLIMVCGFPGEAPATIARHVQAILEEYKVRFVHEAQAGELAADIRREAH